MKTGGYCWWGKVVTVTILCWTLTAEGAIRCYCNRAECQETYTCISHAEICYSKSKLLPVYENDNKTAKTSSDVEYGCLDLGLNLAKTESTGGSSSRGVFELCDGRGDVVKKIKYLNLVIMCCIDKMCNYKESQDIHVDIVDPVVISKGQSSDGADESGEEETVSGAPQNDEDIIFRAAVIAVPIAGGLILVILVLMAVRMLRDDYRRSDSHSGLLKTRNFIEQHFVRKEEKKNYSSKRCYLTSNIKRSSEHIPASVHQHVQSSISRSKDRCSGVNECLIKSENNTEESVSGDICSRPTVQVSLLNTMEKQSNLTLV